MNGLDGLVLIVFCDDDEKRDAWIAWLQTYHLMMILAWQKEDYTDDEINNFEDLADSFVKVWLDLTGWEGITNYIHMIGAGHVVYYMWLYHNLYWCLNQGWESLNSKVKKRYFCNMQHKGNRENGIKQSHIKPIARYFQSQPMWKTGLAYNVFLDHEVVAEKHLWGKCMAYFIYINT